jgi:hypothetical protein
VEIRASFSRTIADVSGSSFSSLSAFDMELGSIGRVAREADDGALAWLRLRDGDVTLSFERLEGTEVDVPEARTTSANVRAAATGREPCRFLSSAPAMSHRSIESRTLGVVSL